MTGRYPCDQLSAIIVRLVPWNSIAGTEFQNAALRALGARVGKRVHIHQGVNLTHGGWDVLDIGDDVTISQDAHVRLVDLADGQVTVGPVTLAQGCILDVRAGVGPDTAVGRGSVLCALSSLPSGGRIGDGVLADGVPAAPIGFAPPAPSAHRRAWSPKTHAIATMLARSLLTIVLRLPFTVTTVALIWWTRIEYATVIDALSHPLNYPLPFAVPGVVGCVSLIVTVALEALGFHRGRRPVGPGGDPAAPALPAPDGMRIGQRVTGVEALVRWAHPVRGVLPPAEFLPLAERSGLIVPLGRWIIREACRQIAAWQAEHEEAAPVVVNVNVSARELREPAFADDVAAALTETGIAPHRLVLEVTETTVFELGTSVANLRALRHLGIRIALDDFGTGHSTLTLLQDCPVDELKLDRSFAQVDPTAEHTIATAVIHLARALGLHVVAEGVETSQQADRLRLLGYEAAQGFYFARPMPAAQISQAIRAPEPHNLVPNGSQRNL